jgi:hypothetical protein
MAGFLGSDFNPAAPADTDPVAQGAASIRDIKQRLKTFFGGLFNLETAAYVNGTIPAAALQAIMGLTAGSYTNVTLTVNASGQITAISSGSAGSFKAAGAVETYATGGTGLATLPANGQIPIGNGAGYALATLAALAGGGITITNGPGTITLSINPAYILSAAFFVQATLVATSAATPVQLLAPLGSSSPWFGRKPYVTKWMAFVNGSTSWTTSTLVQLSDTSGTPIPFVNIPVSALTANARVFESTSGVILDNAIAQCTGGATNAGLQVYADVNAGAGSSLIVQASGFYQ